MFLLTKLYSLSSSSKFILTSQKIFLSNRKFFLQQCFRGVKTSPGTESRTENFRYPNPKLMEKMEKGRKTKAKSLSLYLGAISIFMAGLGFAFVPLFNMYCKTSNWGGTLTVDLSKERTKNLKRIEDMVITISFNADKNSYLNWKFKPLQTEINVYPGETVLAFYSAENPSDKPISGVSTYNVVPFEAARYFNKIQCFCFDEQRLQPHEQVDMPVFFYIDPEIARDPYLFDLSNITLSYTFFEAKPGLDLPFMSSFVDDD